MDDDELRRDRAAFFKHLEQRRQRERRASVLSDGVPFTLDSHRIAARRVEGYQADQSCVVPVLNGQVGRRDDFGYIHYSDVERPIDFDGGVLACAGFISDLYVHIGMQAAWKFERVEQLIFEKGRLTRRTDVSEQLAETRRKAIADAKRAGIHPSLASAT